MTHTPLHFNTQQPVASGSSFKPKRKSRDEDSEDEGDHIIRRIRSPPLKRRSAFPIPDLMTDHSNSASDEDQGMDMDEVGDQDMRSPTMEQSDWIGLSPSPSHSHHFGPSGSGGFGFGPGAEEDELSQTVCKSSHYPAFSVYPSLVAHPNSNHLSNVPSHTANDQNTSPWSAQPFSTSLRAPTRGLIQPSAAGPLPTDATAIEKARAQHGPWCTTIPKLVMSQYGDPSTGEKSLWSMCQDCGACEKAE